MVSKVPIDTGGHLITNELYLEDYSGNPLDASGWASYTYGATLQYGTQIVDITNTYVVTAVASDGIQQSATSTPVSMLNNLYVTGSYNTLSWAAVAGAYTYYVYKLKNGLYGFIGQTPKLTFSDTNIGVDMSITPDIYDPVFGAALDYPGAVSYYQQRRIFAGTNNNPQNLWMTKTGTESDMSYSLPVRDTDRIAIAIATREMSTILHVVPLLQLILLASSCEISASPSNSDAITPSTICARPQSYIGATNVAPAIVNNQLLFCAARGGHVREMGYQWQIGGYVTGDVSLRAAHLFDGFSILDQAFMKAAWQVVWYPSSSGNLLGFTYIPEESVGAWHHHGNRRHLPERCCGCGGCRGPSVRGHHAADQRPDGELHRAHGAKALRRARERVLRRLRSDLRRDQRVRGHDDCDRRNNLGPSRYADPVRFGCQLRSRGSRQRGCPHRRTYLQLDRDSNWQHPLPLHGQELHQPDGRCWGDRQGARSGPAIGGDSDVGVGASPHRRPDMAGG